MLNNTKVTYDITCENNLTHIEKQLFEKSIYWIKDTNTTNNQIRYLKKYNELSMIEINCEQNNYSVLVPLTLGIAADDGERECPATFDRRKCTSNGAFGRRSEIVENIVRIHSKWIMDGGVFGRVDGEGVSGSVGDRVRGRLVLCANTPVSVSVGYANRGAPSAGAH